ncbi:uncharacterized protein FOMMEDRAFT_150142 [Fomitiporia mediterranea MF3/22]|uniref:uncharacterized protein n=1 Tax=Fomitiporia mediterranea (strain MF3/22) TaxID=694068 RepID=UPI0004409408|nr:uncharacterized protein FOMMEDRAFT_150142 [Fomitiporia mediterranea MF3/22]EJD07604.1 hypothetical protein FOMMEDRAFT_150142 [Fomitiporia mediterranea MF3/22]
MAAAFDPTSSTFTSLTTTSSLNLPTTPIKTTSSDTTSSSVTQSQSSLSTDSRTTTIGFSVPTSTALSPLPNANTNQSSSSSISTGGIVGIIFGVVVVLITCHGILLLLRRWSLRWPSVVKSRYNRKEATEAPELRVVTVDGDTQAAVSLLLPPASGQHSWTDGEIKRILPDSNVGSESLQTSNEPVTSMMQEVDSLRARIAEIERRQQQETTRNLIPPDINVNGTEDTQSAPPAYSDDGRP